MNELGIEKRHMPAPTLVLQELGGSAIRADNPRPDPNIDPFGAAVWDQREAAKPGTSGAVGNEL